MRDMTIGDLARRTGAKVETVRYYEKAGLLPAPARTAGNYRAYEPAHLARLSFVLRARRLGFSLDQVRDLLGLADDRERTCDAVDAIARAHLVEVEQKIAELTRLRDELSSVIGRCRSGVVADCRIIESLAAEPA